MITRLRAAMRNAPAHVAAGILIGGLSTLAAALPVAPVFLTLGGGWGEALLGPIGVPIGIALTVLLLLVASFSVGGALGGSISSVIGCLIGALRRPDIHHGHGSSRQG